MQNADFRKMSEATPRDWAIIGQRQDDYYAHRNAGEGLLRILQMQRDDETIGWPINVYRHSLQSATRALRADADEELVVCALFHDVFDDIAPSDHGTAVANFLKPYISAERHWILAHHGLFQQQHRSDRATESRDAIERFRDHPFFAATIDFCARFDENCFDSAYQELPIEAFLPAVDRILGREPYNHAATDGR